MHSGLVWLSSGPWRPMPCPWRGLTLAPGCCTRASPVWPSFGPRLVHSGPTDMNGYQWKGSGWRAMMSYGRQVDHLRDRDGRLTRLRARVRSHPRSCQAAPRRLWWMRPEGGRCGQTERWSGHDPNKIGAAGVEWPARGPGGRALPPGSATAPGRAAPCGRALACRAEVLSLARPNPGPRLLHSCQCGRALAPGLLHSGPTGISVRGQGWRALMSYWWVMVKMSQQKICYRSIMFQKA